ncbi:hypothetical protein [Tenacibaculum piscium]|uniref:Prenyltransferase n=1 Tax=Tenacibaculum piscium TaxID=1458515 RepID=A0A2H1YEZ3_9FLAO|nr:hypothetical protein [Tenacibaculum piscium]MBE7628905.1 hypothetical protein [Tenacibaculum piscium]MBE7671208.1 hypothetical protein [Tenacibaculum piscium]MBE7685074.1 hypothetical protein [Tenacibaculum piscium]MBE7689777.1 hypothetical protein [Tenacibaculum piscium]SOS74066.1 conserved membrane hypothetical protein [Tenacibaculum piscium]
MNFIKKLLDFYINSSIHVSLAVYSFARITAFYTDLSFHKLFNDSLYFFLFFATITGYNFVKYSGVAKLQHRGLPISLKIIQLFSLCSFLLMCFYASKLKVNTLLLLIPLGILTFLYAVPFLSGFQKNLRSIGYLKIGIVALVWTGATVFLPLFDADILSNPIKDTNHIKYYLIGLQRFLLVIVLILPFDIRDVQYDAISLQTIPKKIGVKKTKKLGYFLLILCFFLEFIITPNLYFKKVFLLIFTILLILLMRSSEKQSKYYTSFFVESVPIIWWILLTVFYNKI